MRTNASEIGSRTFRMTYCENILFGKMYYAFPIAVRDLRC